jgi:hypothetical protein
VTGKTVSLYRIVEKLGSGAGRRLETRTYQFSLGVVPWRLAGY